MKKIIVIFLTILILTMFFMCNLPSAQVIRPKARATPSQGSTIITPMIKSTPHSGIAPSSEERVVYVKWPKVSLREGPGTNFKPLTEI